MPRFIASRLAIITFLFSHFVPSHGSAAATQNQPAPAHEVPGMPVIDHDPVDCVIENVHPLFQASVQAQGGLHTVKIYFHAKDYNDFYYVEMAETGNVWQASLPIAAPETNGFVYYIEAVDLSFNMSRTAEHTTNVTGENECERRDEGAPPIAVGSTVPGAPAVPEGFLATGIARLITSTGATQAVGGGIGVTTGVIIAGGAAAAGIGILAGGGSDPEPEPEPPPTVAPPPGGSGGGGGGPTDPTPGPEPEGTDPVACFDTDPNPPVVDINDAVRFNASCSSADKPLRAQMDDKIETYHWRFNDGKADKEGRVVNHLYVRAGTHPAELTVTDSAGNKDTTSIDVIVRGGATGGGGGGGPGGPGPPTGADLSLSWRVAVGGFTVTVSNAGPLPAQNVVLTVSCDQQMTTGGFLNCTPPGASTSKTCAASSPIGVGGSGSVTATVASGSTCQAGVTSATSDPNTANNTAMGTVPQRSPDTIPVALDTEFTSRLDIPPPNGSVRGQVLLNGTQLDQTDNSAPFRHHLKGQGGKNTVQARVVSGTGEGRWVFNFSGAPNFVSGSLAVQSGQVISRGSDRVVFRVGPSGAPIRFRYRLSP